MSSIIFYLFKSSVKRFHIEFSNLHEGELESNGGGQGRWISFNWGKKLILRESLRNKPRNYDLTLSPVKLPESSETSYCRSEKSSDAVLSSWLEPSDGDRWRWFIRNLIPDQTRIKWEIKLACLMLPVLTCLIRDITPNLSYLAHLLTCHFYNRSYSIIDIAI